MYALLIYSLKVGGLPGGLLPLFQAAAEPRDIPPPQPGGGAGSAAAVVRASAVRHHRLPRGARAAGDPAGSAGRGRGGCRRPRCGARLPLGAARRRGVSPRCRGGAVADPLVAGVRGAADPQRPPGTADGRRRAGAVGPGRGALQLGALYRASGAGARRGRGGDPHTRTGASETAPFARPAGGGPRGMLAVVQSGDVAVAARNQGHP